MPQRDDLQDTITIEGLETEMVAYLADMVTELLEQAEDQQYDDQADVEQQHS